MIPQKNEFSYARGFLKQGVVAKDYGKLLTKHRITFSRDNAVKAKREELKGIVVELQSQEFYFSLFLHTNGVSSAI